VHVDGYVVNGMAAFQPLVLVCMLCGGRMKTSFCPHRAYTPAQQADMQPYHSLRHHQCVHKKTIKIALAKHWETPWSWVLREPKYFGVFIVTLILFRVDATCDVH